MELTELESILHMEKGKKPKAQVKVPTDGYLPYVDIKAFEQGVIDNYATIENSLLCEDGDLLIVCDGSRSGLTGIAMKGVVGSTLSKIYADGMTTKYLRYYIQSKYTLLNTRKKGTGTPHLNAEILKKSKLIVPSIPEQERIVTRIEELFSELDKAVETLQTTKKQLAVYRQAVLKEAFSGRITNSKLLEHKALGHYIEKPRYGTSKKCSYDRDVASIAVYRIPNVDYRTGCIDCTDIKYADFSESELSDLKLEEGDILIIRSNGSVSLVGRAALVRAKDVTGTFAGYLMRLRIKDKNTISPQYVLYYLQSREARSYIERKAKSTSGVNNINSSEISGLEIPIYPFFDQIRIVSEIESRLSVCDSIEKTVDTALGQAEAMRQSILKEAFEGRLV